jgi:RsiW-degrading membrane proteinase PrsW (M82 family)
MMVSRFAAGVAKQLRENFMDIIGLLIATAIPLLVLYIIYTLDLYKTGNFRYVLMCFAWGGVAFACAFFSNRFIYTQEWLTRENIQRFGAPVIEEILKALILIYLIRRPNFTYFVDGAIYGFAIGIGFAVFENYEYIFEASGAGLGLAVSRVLSTNLIHASASALVGVAFGLARFQRSLSRIGVVIAGLLAAMFLHILFNNMVTRVEGPLLLVFSVVIGFTGVGLIAFAIFRGLREEKAWIEEKLGAADRVTRQEAAYVNRMSSDMSELLKPVEKFFGPEKMPQVERFLVIQARLGILRKTLDKLNNDEKMSQAVKKQMGELQVEMDTLRKGLGAYNMLHLRGIIPSEASPLWTRMSEAINHRAAARPAGNSGPNLWASLGKRTDKQPPAKDPSDAP